MPPVPDLGGSRLALVIGTATYTDPGFRQLRAPAQDVADMAEVLADPSIGGFAVTEVLDRTEYQLRREIDAFLTGRRVDDLVVVYLSCHGVLDARGRLYFAATDTDKSRLSSTGVESAWLLDQLEQCRARRQVLILDCCFSGSFAHTKGDPEVDLERRLVGAGRGRAVLTASRGGEYSYEGTPLPGAPGGSVFTAALVDGLRSGAADRDGDGLITVEDAYDYAANQVTARGGAQSPQRWLYGAEGAVVLARNPRVASHESPAAAVQDLVHHTNPPTSPDSGLVGAHPVRRHQLPRSAPTAHSPRSPVPLGLVKTIRARRNRIFSTELTAIVFSSDGGLLASGGADGTVRLWDPTNGKRVGRPFTGHTGRVRAVVFSPDGRLLASVGDDKTVRLWDRVGGQPVGHLLTTHSGGVSTVVFSPDGRLLASGHDDGTVRLWDPSTGQPVGHTPTGRRAGWVHSVVFSPDGHLLVSGHDSGVGTVRLWDPSTGQLVGQPLTGHTHAVRALVFSPDGCLLASGSEDRTVRLWDPATGKPAGHLVNGHTDSVTAVAFSPDGRLLASGSTDRTVRLWDLAAGKPVGYPLSGHTGGVREVAFSPDGRLLISVGYDKTVRLWGGEP